MKWRVSDKKNSLVRRMCVAAQRGLNEVTHCFLFGLGFRTKVDPGDVDESASRHSPIQFTCVDCDQTMQAARIPIWLRSDIARFGDMSRGSRRGRLSRRWWRTSAKHLGSSMADKRVMRSEGIGIVGQRRKWKTFCSTNILADGQQAADPFTLLRILNSATKLILSDSPGIVISCVIVRVACSSIFSSTLCLFSTCFFIYCSFLPIYF